MNVKKGDLAIKIGGPNIGALVRVLDECSWDEKAWMIIAMEPMISVEGFHASPGDEGWTYDAWLRPLRDNPRAEVKIGDTRPCET